MLFIHGLGGDAFSTWRHGADDSTSWPHWLAKEFPHVAVWSLGFAASPTRWARFLQRIGWGTRDSGYSMPLPARALQVLDRLTQKGIGQRPLIVVCHSLGGLLAKQVLMTADDPTADPRARQLAANTRAVLFLATPHVGADLASLLNLFRVVFGSTVSIEDLRAHDAHLLSQYNWYRRNADRLGIATRTYYETRGVGGVLAIVDATSAQCGVGPDAVPLDEDHLSIAKPRQADEQVCDALRDLMRNHLFASPPTAKHLATAEPQSVEPSSVESRAAESRSAEFRSVERRFVEQAPREVTLRLAPPHEGGEQAKHVPRELPPVAFKFFGREVERQQLAARLRAGLSTAVVGPAGMGKTALAGDVLTEVVGANGTHVESSPFPDGLVYLDLYRLQGQAEPTWNALANRLRGAEFMERRSAKERATEACRGKRCLIIIEGGEEADGSDGRTTIADLFEVLSPENRWLLLTRVSTQAATQETVSLREVLSPQDASDLLDWLTKNRPLAASTRAAALRLLDGHPLALNWAGDLLARDEEDPAALVHEWESKGLPSLADPKEAQHTLQWLFSRSVRGLDETTRQALAAAGMLALAPFPVEAIAAALAVEAEIDPSDRSPAQRALVTLARSGLLRRSEDNLWQFTHVLGYLFARSEDASDPVMQLRLATWLKTQIEASLKADAVAQAAANLGRQLEHIAALLRTDPDQRLWDSLASPLLYEISDRLEIIGRLDLVSRALQAVADWLARIPLDKAKGSYWLFQRCILMNDQGDVLGDQGDLDGAIRTYREALALLQRLTQSDPANKECQRELSTTHDRIGDLLRAQGDVVNALAEYQASLVIKRRLVLSDLTGDRQRDLSVTQANIGSALFAQGQLVDALAAFQGSAEVMRRLVTGDPANLSRQADLSVIQERVGEIFHTQGDLNGAIAAYQETLESRRRLVEADPTNARWQRSLSYSLTKLAGLYEKEGRPMDALQLAEESLSIDQHLVSLDPSNALWQKDLRVSRTLVARLRETTENS